MVNPSATLHYDRSTVGSGRKLTTNGTAGDGPIGNVTMTAMFKSKPPEDFVVKFYLITDKLVVAVPLEFKDIPVLEKGK